MVPSCWFPLSAYSVLCGLLVNVDERAYPVQACCQGQAGIPWPLLLLVDVPSPSDLMREEWAGCFLPYLVPMVRAAVR